MSSFLRVFALIAFLVGGWGLPHDSRAQDDPNRVYAPALYKAMKYRLIGPYRGGRVTAVTGIAAQPYTFYMGATGGGVWKTDDAGDTWRNVSDGYLKAGSIGAVAVAPSDPNVVYVGTGSAAPRGNVSPGVGLYKSVDAGVTWEAAGLEKAGQIAKVVVHPKDPDVVYVAALGNIFGPNPERGVFRSQDGGATWAHVLALSDSTGAIDLAIDPGNARILYAGMWRAERKPWTLIDGSTEGGVYKSKDAGTTWKRLEGGLPEGLVGKVGVAVSPANTKRIWVLQAAADEKKGGLYRSDDGGKSFQRINREHNLRQRAWYYSYVIADPQDENTVYVLNTGMYKSVDGGKTFERIRVPHGDNHGLWINPHNTDIMINSNDGGANVSFNGGRTWSTQQNQPTAEFYRVTVDNQFPYRVYGAQQDNSTISVPSSSPGGITPQQHWYAVGGGESGHIAVDPRNPDLIYAGTYIGQITRLDRAVGHQRNVTAYPQMHDGTAPRDIRYRFQWNAPILISPHNPDVLYHTSQYVHRSTDGGQSWETISPDLTTDNDAYHDIPGGPIQHDHTGVELYTTIFAFAESPHTPGELWAGSDDGRVHLSRDNGASWDDITPPTMPAEGTVNTMELSPHTPGRAFLAVYKYRESDFRPYLFRTDDYGQSWVLLTDGTNGIPEGHFTRVIREDPDRRGLLYAGTEFGLYVSFDDGAHWQPFQNNLPITPITDLVVHQQDLVVATQGRSFWVMDDLTPLHQLADTVAAADVHLFAPRPAFRTQLRSFGGANAPESRPNGALLSFYLAEKPDSTLLVMLEIIDRDQQVVRTFSTQPDKEKKEGTLAAQAGMNRFVWDLNYHAPNLVEGAVMSLAYTGGPKAATGMYTVRLTMGTHTQTQPLEIKKDPRWGYSDADLQAQFDLTMAVLDKLNETHDAIRTIRSVREQTKALADRAVKAGHAPVIRTAAQEIGEKLTALEKKLIQTQNESSQDPINYPSMLDDQFAYLYTVVNFQDARPTAGSYERFEDLKAQLQPHLDTLQDLLTKDVPTFNTLLTQEGVPHVVLPTK